MAAAEVVRFLFLGPPGTGKTAAIKAFRELAGQTLIPMGESVGWPVRKPAPTFACDFHPPAFSYAETEVRMTEIGGGTTAAAFREIMRKHRPHVFVLCFRTELEGNFQEALATWWPLIYEQIHEQEEDKLYPGRPFLAFLELSPPQLEFDRAALPTARTALEERREQFRYVLNVILQTNYYMYLALPLASKLSTLARVLECMLEQAKIQIAHLKPNGRK